MKRKSILIALCIALLAQPLCAQHYRSSRLREAAEKLHLASYIANIKDAPTIAPFDLDGQRVYARIDGNHRVEHLGIPLFSAEVRQIMPSPIYDFLEFAVLEHKYHTSDNPLLQDQVKFSIGGWGELIQVTPELPCEVNQLEENRYVITWQRDSVSWLQIFFPVNYEVLANSTRREMEQDFIQNLLAFKASPHTTWPAPQRLEPYSVRDIYVSPGTSYLMPVVTSNTYYSLSEVHLSDTVQSADVEPTLLIDRNMPRETFANLLLTAAPSLPKADMSLSFLCYGNRVENRRVTLRAWTTYCMSIGCTPFYMYEGTEDGTTTACVIMRNRQSGYDHVAYLRCNLSDVRDGRLHMEGQVYLFVPSTNVKELFAKPGTEKSTKKIYE